MPNDPWNEQKLQAIQQQQAVRGVEDAEWLRQRGISPQPGGVYEPMGLMEMGQRAIFGDEGGAGAARETLGKMGASYLEDTLRAPQQMFGGDAETRERLEQLYPGVVKRRFTEELDPIEQSQADLPTLLADIATPGPGGEAKGMMRGMVTGSREAANVAKGALRKLQDLAPESLPGRWAARVEDPNNLRDVLEMYGALPREAVEHFKAAGSPGVRGAAWKQRGVQKAWVKPGGGAELHEVGGHGSYADLPSPQRSFWEKQVSKHGRHPGVPKRITKAEEVASESYAETMEDLLTGRSRHPELEGAMAQAMGVDPPKPKVWPEFGEAATSKRSLQGSGFDTEKYTTSTKVRVRFPDGSTFEDEIKGLNKGHAIARARQNWPGATIYPFD